MIIFLNNTQIDLPVNDNSYRYRAIKGEHSLTLYYSLSEHVEIPLGAYCFFEGETYTLENPENFKKHNTRNFEYTLIMEATQAKLKKYKFKDTNTRLLKFSLTATPKEHLQMLVDNLNQCETDWEVGACIDAVEKVISYNHAFCSEALSQMADEFETEWEIVGKTINLRKVEYNKDNPLPLSYGRGNGFKSGVGRTSGDKKPVEILYVQGGERNIDASKYPTGAAIKSRELLLPNNQETGYDGEYFSHQEEFNPGQARWYVTDADGFSLRRSGKDLESHAEDSLDCSHIYPSLPLPAGFVTGVEEVDAEKHFWDFFDTKIPQSLDFSQYRINGEKITIIFQSGMLTGKEFDLEQTDNSVTGYIHSERRFRLVPQEIDGRTMPDDTFCPQIGDRYAVFGMMLPESYICDNETKSGASWDMFREAVKFMYENEEQKFTFTGELDGIWAKKDWLNIGGRIKLGGYVLFSDNQFQSEGILIRVIGIKDFINNPHSPQIELSNEIVGNSILSNLRKIETNEVVMSELHRDALQFTKRHFRDSQETLSMLQNALLEGFGDSVSPITIQTMAMLVGDESLQFRFVNNKTNPTGVTHSVTYNQNTKILTSPTGIIQHLTLGIKTLSPSYAVSEYKFWDIFEAYTSPPLTDSQTPYYFYAKVDKIGTTGEFILSENAIKMEQDNTFYHLLMGILGSESEGERSYVSLYGFTEILPGRITTDNIVSSDGNTYFNLQNGEIGGNIKFSSNGINIPIQEGIDNSIDKIGIGAVNLILNSAFSGDYESLDMDANINLDTESELFSKSLIHWEGNANVIESTESASGYVCRVYTLLSQTLYRPLIDGEHYVLSFKAKGNITVKIGTFSHIQSITGDHEKIVLKFEAMNAIKLEFTGDFTICEIQLERGTIATEWSLSPRDNNRTLAEFEAIRYLSDAIRGKTSILGGLILTSMIQLGIFKDGEFEKITAGMSGIYNDDNDVAFWAGGKLKDAIRAVMSPDNEGANAVITHGGKAIFNEAIIRGVVYATSGIFKGRIEADEGYFTGTVESNKNGNRIVIDPTGRRLILYDATGRVVGRWSFVSGGSYLSVFFYVDPDTYEMQTNGAHIVLLKNTIKMIDLSCDGIYINSEVLPTSPPDPSTGHSIYRNGNQLMIAT